MGSIYETFDDDLKYKYGGDRQKMWQVLKEEEATREEQKKEAIRKPVKDQLIKIQNINSELMNKIKQLEQAGNRIVKLVSEVYAMIGGPCILQDAVKEWEKAKEEAE